MSRCSANWFIIFVVLGLIFSVFFYCEYLIYYAAISKCAWPKINSVSRGRHNSQESTAVLRAIVLSDTHLLGAIGGHWFDKLRREWQMERAFQTALWLLRPEVVFILGDIFDEGKWSSPKHWEDDVSRFQHMFRHPSDTELVVLVGNHDIGLHYEMDWYKLQRFEKVFNASSTRIVTKKGINFLLVNSVALHGDGCPICQAVEKELLRLAQHLNCSLQYPAFSHPTENCGEAPSYPPSRPILMQHYPLYRVSDSNCRGVDSASIEERHLLFREKYDVLSKEASQRLLQLFKPRLILSGHTHNGCEVLHDNQYPEISVPSFNWRNRNNPSFILASFSASGHALSKCFLPEESSVILLYGSLGGGLLLLLLLLLLLTLARCLWSHGLLLSLQPLLLDPLGKNKLL